MNKALAGRQWFHPNDTPWGQMIAQKAAENAAMIKPQINDDTAPAGYYRALRDVAAWMPKNAILSAEDAGRMDIGLTQLQVSNARSRLNASTYGTMGVGLGQANAPASCTRTGRSSTSRGTLVTIARISIIKSDYRAAGLCGQCDFQVHCEAGASGERD